MTTFIMLAAVDAYGDAEATLGMQRMLTVLGGSAPDPHVQRKAAHAYARVKFLANIRPVSLIRGFVPHERMPCGCPPGQRMPHADRAHADRWAYERRIEQRDEEIIDWYRSRRKS